MNTVKKFYFAGLGCCFAAMVTGGAASSVMASSAGCIGLEGCDRKICEKEAELREAKNYNDTQKILGLQDSLVHVRQECALGATGTQSTEYSAELEELLDDYKDDLDEALDDYNDDLKEAQAEGKQDKIERAKTKYDLKVQQATQKYDTKLQSIRTKYNVTQ